MMPSIADINTLLLNKAEENNNVLKLIVDVASTSRRLPDINATNYSLLLGHNVFIKRKNSLRVNCGFIIGFIDKPKLHFFIACKNDNKYEIKEIDIITDIIVRCITYYIVNEKKLGDFCSMLYYQ